MYRPVILLALLILVALTSRADETRSVSMRPVPPETGYEVVYRATVPGKSGISETYTVHAVKLEHEGRAYYQSISDYPDRTRWVTMDAKDLTPVAVVEKEKGDGGLIKRIYDDGSVYMLRRGVHHPWDFTVDVPAGVHDPETFAFLLKGYPFEEQDTMSPISVLFTEPIPLYSSLFDRPLTFDVLIIPHGTEKVAVPAGEFECYVLEMTVAGPLRYIVPKNRFWLLKEYPHMIVRAEGAGETIELVGGPFKCDGNEHCITGANKEGIGREVGRQD